MATPRRVTPQHLCAAGSLDVSGPFTRAAALDAGLTDRDLNGPAYRRLVRGTYVHVTTPPSAALWARSALLLTPPGSFASHHTAARLLGVAVPASELVHVGAVTRLASTHRAVRLHRYAEPPALVMRDAVPCTDGVQTFLDLASVLGLLDLVVLGDGLVAAGWTGRVELVARTAAWAGRGARAGRRAAALVRDRVESAMETRTRLLFVLAGLPEPAVNLTVRSARTGRSYRLDLSWPHVKVAVEYDGRHHIERAEQWHADLARREDLEGLGWRFVVLTARDLFVTPAATLTRVIRVLAESGMPVPPMRSEWERHFGQAWRSGS